LELSNDACRWDKEEEEILELPRARGKNRNRPRMGSGGLTRKGEGVRAQRRGWQGKGREPLSCQRVGGQDIVDRGRGSERTPPIVTEGGSEDRIDRGLKGGWGGRSRRRREGGGLRPTGGRSSLRRSRENAVERGHVSSPLRFHEHDERVGRKSPCPEREGRRGGKNKLSEQE